MQGRMRLTAAVSIFLLANSCAAQEQEVRPQGCLDRVRARWSSCLPEMRLVKKALPIAIVEEVALTGMAFTQMPPNVFEITIPPLIGSIAMGIIAYKVFKKSEGQNIHKKALILVSGQLASWISPILGFLNDWPSDAIGSLSLACGIGGLGATAGYTFYSVYKEAQNGHHEELLAQGNQGINV